MQESDQERHEDRMREIEEDDLGEEYRYLHLSALSPTTRKSHAKRHGRLFTAAEVKKFWSDPRNVEGCKCTVVPIMVDEKGKPIVKAIVDRAKETLKKMSDRGYDWSK